MKFNCNFMRIYANVTDICKFDKVFKFTYITPPSRKKVNRLMIIDISNSFLPNINKKLLILKRSFTAQKMKLSITNFFTKGDRIRRKIWIWSHLLKKSLMENFVFCALLGKSLSELLEITQREVNII